MCFLCSNTKNCTFVPCVLFRGCKVQWQSTGPSAFAETLQGLRDPIILCLMTATTECDHNIKRTDQRIRGNLASVKENTFVLQHKCELTHKLFGMSRGTGCSRLPESFSLTSRSSFLIFPEAVCHKNKSHTMFVSQKQSNLVSDLDTKQQKALSISNSLTRYFHKIGQTSLH